MNVSSLYQKWNRLVSNHPERVAFRNLPSGEEWTFAELHQAQLAHHPAHDARILYPQSPGIEFLIVTLSAWRENRILCPIEQGAEKLPLSANETEQIPEEIAHIKQTSGSTGTPRRVLFRPEQLLCDAEKIIQTMGLHQENPNLGVISLAHSYGFSNLILPLLLHGIPLWWLGSPLPGGLRKCFQSAPTTQFSLPAVPAMWKAWHGAGVLSTDSISLAISAGAPLGLELEHSIWEKCGLKIHNFYGSSECGGIAYDDSETPRTNPAQVGRSMSQTDLFVDADSHCLCVRSVSVAEGYFGSEAESDRLQNGVFHTSDQARITEDGTVELGDRADDLIHVAGRKVSPGKIEQAISTLPGVEHCVVFGIPSRNRERVEDVVAVVHSGGLSQDELERQLHQLGRLRSFEIPRKWWITSELQPDSRGKLSRAQWKKKFLRT